MMRISLIIFIAAYTSFASVEGYWASIRKENNEISAIWKLSIEDGILKGYIVDYPNAIANETCTNCTGDAAEFHNKPIIGTPWLTLKQHKNGVWTKGYIVDADEGKKYGARIWEEAGNLHVRGYVGVFFDTRIWKRHKPVH